MKSNTKECFESVMECLKRPAPLLHNSHFKLSCYHSISSLTVFKRSLILRCTLASELLVLSKIPLYPLRPGSDADPKRASDFPCACRVEQHHIRAPFAFFNNGTNLVLDQ